MSFRDPRNRSSRARSTLRHVDLARLLDQLAELTPEERRDLAWRDHDGITEAAAA